MKIKQRKEKIPFVIFWLALGGFLMLLSLFSSDSGWSDDFPRSKALFFGAWTIGFAILWFFFGSLDWSQWNEIKRRIGKGTSEPPTEAEDPIESVASRESEVESGGLPTTFWGWCAALAGACALIWFLVSFVANVCNALLQ